MSTIKTSGKELNATLARLRKEGRHITSISVGQTPGQWVVSAAEPELRQSDLDLLSADSNTLAQEREVLAKLSGGKP